MAEAPASAAESRWKNAVLVVVGHGAASVPESVRSTVMLAGALRARGLFAAVEPAFLKVAPLLGDMLDRFRGRRVYLVPHLAAEGVVGGEILPSRLAGHDTVVCRATGTHEDVPRLVAARLAELRAAFGLDAARLGVLVAGHGTPRNSDSAARANALAGALVGFRACAEARAAFIEDEPRIGGWDRLLAASEIAVVPLLMAEGRHGGGDVARMLGLAEDDPELPALGEGRPFAGPFALRGRNVWLLRPLGTDPAFAGIALARVAEADAAR